MGFQRKKRQVYTVIGEEFAAGRTGKIGSSKTDERTLLYVFGIEIADGGVVLTFRTRHRKTAISRFGRAPKHRVHTSRTTAASDLDAALTRLSFHHGQTVGVRTDGVASNRYTTTR